MFKTRKKYSATNNNLYFPFGNQGLFCIAIFFIFLFSNSFTFANQEIIELNSTENTIVYSSNNQEGVIVTSGKITAIEGKTIRLLPGTHIKSNEQLSVNISSKTEQELLAIRVAKEKEKAMLCTVSKLRNDLLSFNDNVIIPVVFNTGQAPIEKSTLGQQSLQFTALLVSTTVSLSAPISYLNKQNTHLYIHQLPVMAKHTFNPTNSWGECAETIKVMRC